MNTGRKCDGYSPVAEKARQEWFVTSQVRECSLMLPTRLLQDFEGDSDECRSFHYFRNRTAFQVSGYFPSEFWGYLVPLCTHHHPAIKHAVIALASLHERFEQSDKSILSPNDDILQGGFALRQYNYAISHLTNGFGNGGKLGMDVCLVACILFALFEVSLYPLRFQSVQLTPLSYLLI